MAAIKRVIYVESLEKIDTSNVGLHWTANASYTHSFNEARFPYSTSVRCPRTNCIVKKTHYRVEFTVAFSYATIETNKDATLESRKNYPHECEVILGAHQELRATVRIYEMLDDSVKHLIKKEKKIINTGSRCDAWVLNF